MERSPNKGSFLFVGENPMNDVVVTTVMQYINEHLFEPRINWSKVEFRRRTYSRWAAYEIIELLMNHPFDDSELVVEDFILKMFYCLHVAEGNNKSDFVFLSAIEVAEDILFLCRR